MKKQNNEVNTTTQTSSKKSYEAPKATFVPLKQEERLLSCMKVTPQTCVSIVRSS